MAEDRPRRVLVLHSTRDPATREGTVNPVAAAVAKLGHQTDVFGVTDDLDALAERLGKWRPDLVVNLVEQFAGNPLLAPDLAAALELFQVPFTGAGPAGLYLARDLTLARRLLLSHGLAVAPEAGEGPALSIGVVGNEPVEVLPPDGLGGEEVSLLARSAMAALRLRDYAVLEVRRMPDGGIGVVRPVSNPPLGVGDPLPRAARRAGWTYDALIRRIIDEAWARKDEAARVSTQPRE